MKRNPNARLRALTALYALIMAPATAMAAAPTGVVGTFTGNAFTATYDGSDAESLGFDGTLAWGFRRIQPFAIQITGAYHTLSRNGDSGEGFDLATSVFWAPERGRAGATIAYKSFDISRELDANVTAFGVLGEYYPGDRLTIGVRGGAFNPEATTLKTEGSYVAGMLTHYVTPNVALWTELDYFGYADGDIIGYLLAAEWEVWHGGPVSIFGGYRNSQISTTSVHVSTWFAGIRFFPGAAGTALVDHHRNGTLGWIGDPLGLFVF